MFGFGWSSPQLESSAKPEKDGVLWKTAWDEEIRFYEKEKSTKEMLELYREGMKGRGDYYSPYAQWEAGDPDKICRFLLTNLEQVEMSPQHIKVTQKILHKI